MIFSEVWGVLVRFWGSRGSLPVSGERYIRYGGNTTCVEVRNSAGDIIIVDAGTGVRELGNALMAEGRRSFHMLFTHGHWDHVLGFPFFLPIYSRSTSIEVFGCATAQKTAREILEGTMEPPNFPVEFYDVSADIRFNGVCPRDYDLNGLRVETIPLTHPNGGHGYRFTENGRSFVFLTDNELGAEHAGGVPFGRYAEFSEGAALLVHDAEYRPEEYRRTKGWGHSVFTDALRLAGEAGAERFGLFHHNVERTDDDLDKMVEECRRIAGPTGPECFGVSQESSFEI